jgi:outer membrane murein-binding lipoprotein Lpp
MNDATRRVAEGWGFEPEIEELLDDDVELDYLAILLLIDQNRKVDKLMADVSGLEAAIAELTTTEEAVVTAVTSLKDEISTLEAGSISQEKIDSIKASVEGVTTALKGVEPAPTTPPAEEAPPAAE